MEELSVNATPNHLQDLAHQNQIISHERLEERIAQVLMTCALVCVRKEMEELSVNATPNHLQDLAHQNQPTTSLILRGLPETEWAHLGLRFLLCRIAQLTKPA